MVRLGLDTTDLLVASVAKAVRDRMTRGHAAECEKARLGHDDAAVGHAPGIPWREAAALRQTAEVGRAAGDRVYIAIARLPVHSRSKEAGGAGMRRYGGQTAAQVVQLLRPHGQDVTRNPGFFAIVRGQSALASMQINSANWPRRRC